MNSNEIPIAFCINRKFCLLFKVALHTLLQSADDGTYYVIYIVSDDLSEDGMEGIQAVAGRFNDKCSIIFKEINNTVFEDAGFRAKNGSFSYYYRIALPLLISEHSRILYSDADVLFFGDLTKYYYTDISDSYLGVVQFDHKSYFTDDYDFDGKYFASGNLLMNLDKCRSFNMLKMISDVARKYEGKLRHHDQDCLNVMFYDQVAYLPLNFCVNHKLHQDIARDRYYDLHLRNYQTGDIMDAIENPDIVHYTGPKPDKSSPSCSVWQLACAQAGLIDEYIETVVAHRKAEK